MEKINLKFERKDLYTTEQNSNILKVKKIQDYKLKTLSNRQIIRNALVHACLAGLVNEKTKHDVLEVYFFKKRILTIHHIIISLYYLKE